MRSVAFGSAALLAAFVGGPAFAQAEFGAPSGLVFSEEGLIEAVRFIGGGQAVVTMFGVDPAMSNPAGCPVTNDGFKVRLGGEGAHSAHEALIFAARAGEPIRLLIEPGSAAGGACDGVGRPIAVGVEVDFDLGIF